MRMKTTSPAVDASSAWARTASVATWHFAMTSRGSWSAARPAGTGRAWAARPGEYHLATTGQMGGIWTGFQRWGQKLVGNTFAGEGFPHSQPYRRMPDSYDPALAWITEGVGELIGDFGLGNGGAAGIEIDSYRLGFGTPPNAKIIASSGGHPDNYIAHDEEGAYSHQGFSGTHNYILRADIVYFEAPKNGAVFATGSIAFGMALPINGFENNVSQLLANVVNAFVKPGPLPGSSHRSEAGIGKFENPASLAAL